MGLIFLSLEESKGIVRKMFEVVNKRRLNALDNVVAPNFVDHLHQLKGLEAFKQTLAEIYKSFSDFSEKIEDIVAEGDKVWVRLTQTGTHTDEFHGLAPTSKKFVISSVDIFRIVNGKIIEG